MENNLFTKFTVFKQFCIYFFVFFPLITICIRDKSVYSFSVENKFDPSVFLNTFEINTKYNFVFYFAGAYCCISNEANYLILNRML